MTTPKVIISKNWNHHNHLFTEPLPRQLRETSFTSEHLEFDEPENGLIWWMLVLLVLDVALTTVFVSCGQLQPV